MNKYRKMMWAIGTLIFVAMASLLFKGNSVQAEGFEYYEGVYKPYEGATYSLHYTRDFEGVHIVGPTGYDGESPKGELVIPDQINGVPVVSIGWGAFKDCDGFEGELVLPDSVTYINVAAFCGCTGLTSLVLPNSVTRIERLAFDGCYGFRGELVLPDSVTYIGNYAFRDCRGFRGELVIPDSVTEIGNEAFSGCSGLAGLELSNSVTEIADGAFRGCSGLTSLELPNSVTEIGDGAFRGCSGLTGLELPNSVTKIGSSAFRGCSGLTGLELPNSVTYVGDNVFRDCSGLESLELPDSVNSIDSYAFSGCTGLTSLELPDSVTWIGDYAFSGCTGLTGLELPDSVNSIYSYAFSGCTGLTGLELPDGMNSIDSYAFSGCSGLTSLELPNYIGRIGDYAFRGCSGLTSLELPNYMERMGEYAFSGCTGLTSLEIPNGVWEIGPSAFSGCTGLTSLTIWGSPDVKKSSFEGCDKITEVKYGYKPCGLETLKKLLEDSLVYYPSYVDGWDEVIETYPNYNWVQYEPLVIPFVERMYQVALDRASDEKGLKDWVDDLLSGDKTGAEVAYCFIFSPEFKEKNYCNEHYIMQLYKAFMGREYDEDGLNYWLHLLKTGSTREAVFNGFSQSNEFKGICESYGIELGEPIVNPQYGTVPMGSCSVDGKEDGVTSFVKRLYNICLDREAEGDGLDYWTEKLWSHECSGMTAAFGFVFSPEFMDKNHSDADYVEYLYEAFMGRSSDVDGKAYWLGRIANEGLTREDVFNGFAYSPEFTGICNGYGIVAY